MVVWRYEISLLVLKKIFHLFAALIREIFFNTRREILYLPVAMKDPLCIKGVELEKHIRAFFPMGQNKLSIIMSCPF